MKFAFFNFSNVKFYNFLYPFLYIIHILFETDRNKTLSVEEYLNKIRPDLKDIQIISKSTTHGNSNDNSNKFIFLIDNDKEHVMHSKSRNIEIIMNHKADEIIEIIEEMFDSLNYGDQNNIESIKGSEFVLDYLLY